MVGLTQAHSKKQAAEIKVYIDDTFYDQYGTKQAYACIFIWSQDKSMYNQNA